MKLTLNVNARKQAVEIAPETPLLYALRNDLKFNGPKFGCGLAQCGACTVHIDGEPTRSCVTSVEDVQGRRITTIEGLSADRTHPVQVAWIAEQVPQCGYCQSGMLMTAAELLKRKPKPTDADIDAAIGGHICRCGTYPRIRKAIQSAAARATRPASNGGAK